MTERKPLSKKIRFEIFKRDQFTCQYCGRKPPEIMLVVDHIHPVKLGGENDELNLITACNECNQGKAANPLGQIQIRPDTDLKQLEMYQEIAELKNYQKTMEQRDQIYAEWVKRFQELWWEIVDKEYAPNDNKIISWINKVSPTQIEQAIRITANKPYLGNYTSKVKYCSAIIRNMREESEEEE